MGKDAIISLIGLRYLNTFDEKSLCPRIWVWQIIISIYKDNSLLLKRLHESAISLLDQSNEHFRLS